MPPRLADKAKQATVLCQRLQGVRSVAEKRVYAERLDELWPDIRCRVTAEGRLCVYALAERVQRIPKMLNFTAYYIEEVRRDGTARVMKNKLCDDTHDAHVGTILPEAGIELDAFEGFFDLPEPRSAWDRICDDEDDF